MQFDPTVWHKDAVIPQPPALPSAGFCGRRIVSMVYWAVSSPAAGAAADAVCCLLAEKTHRDQLMCTVINREETFERSARRRSQPGHVTVKRSHLTRTFYLINGLYPPRLNPLINSAQRRHPRIGLWMKRSNELLFILWIGCLGLLLNHIVFLIYYFFLNAYSERKICI